jgi:LytS/YehU family sensor histidine kinase
MQEHMRFWFMFLRHAGTAVIGYWLVVGVWHAVDSSRRLKARELQTSQLEAQLATARLQALEDQLHPHFLFNTLNTLSSLIYEDVKAADKVIRDLSTLLRLALDNAGTHTVPLEDEIRFVGVYLDIMKTRYPNRLEVALEIDPATNAFEVPNLLLQPIVENSIKHGLEATDGVVRVDVRTRLEDDRLCVEVTDDGPGLPPEQSLREGVGLGNTRNRLRQLYGVDFGFRIGNRDGGGVSVHIEVPPRPTNKGGGA